MSQYELRPIWKVYSNEGAAIAELVYCASLNHFFLLDDKGRFFLADGNGEVIFGPVTTAGVSGDAKISIDYLNFHNCLLAWDGDKLNIRRDLGGSWLMKTILAEKPNTESKDTVAIELTLNEATKLLNYLITPAIKLSSANTELLKEVISDLSTSVDEAKEAEKLSRGHKWPTVLLRGPYAVLLSTLIAALSDLKQSNLRLPILPVISAVVERLNLMKEQSFVFDARSEATPIDKSLMASEAARRLTFSQWPHMDYKWALPDQMAEAGFYHQPNSSGDDRVFCFTCTVCLVCWEPADEPWSEHERHSPTCAFVKGEYTQNVPISVTYASSPALACGCADKVTHVSKSSYCDWVASSTRYGEIVMWNVAKELKKCDPILLDPSEPFLEMKTGYRCRSRRHLKSGVAWADETELLNQNIGASPSSVGQEAIHETIDTSNEISGEILATCPQKGDFVVTSVCACGQPASKRTVSETLNADAKCSPALIIGCGIMETKLRTDQRVVEVGSPTSFVENLNTVNKATCIFNECILPPKSSNGASSSSSLEDQDSSSNSSHSRYRPFILVYKIDDAVEERRGVLYAEKSRRTGTVQLPTAAVDKNTLASVKEIDESSQSPPDDELENVVDEKEESTDEDKAGQLHPVFANNWNSNTVLLPDYEQSAFAQPQQKLDKQWVLQQASTSGDAFSSASSEDPDQSVSMKPSDYVTLPTISGKSSVDVHSTEENMIKLCPQPLKTALSVLQCLRLPSQLDSSLYYVHSIVPAADGLSVIVVVNRSECAADKEASAGVSSAILIYRLSFSCHMTSLVEQPSRQISFDADAGLLETVVPLQSMGAGDEASWSNLLAILTKHGDLRVMNADTSQTLAKSSPAPGRKYTAVCSFHEDRLCVACDDGSISTLELLRTDTVTPEAESTVQSLVDDSSEWKDPDLLVNKPLTLDVLKDLWQLTRSDWATSGQFNMQAPSSWVEVQQHQRLRKNPQHYLREEKLAKSWHLVPDNDTWSEHLFEITLPANFSASHVDFRFVLHHPAAVGMPAIQVTFLRQLPTSAARSSGLAFEWGNSLEGAAAATSSSLPDLPSTSSTAAEEGEQRLLKNHVFNKTFLEYLHADVIAGPYDLHTALDLYNSNGLIQFSSAELSNSKLRTFYIHVQALTKGGTQNGQSKSSNSNAGLHKIPSAGNAAAMETASAGLYQQKYGSSKYGVPSGKSASSGSIRVVPSRHATEIRKSEDLHGCDWIQEVSVTIWRTKKTTLRKEKKQRLAMAKNADFALNLVKALECGVWDGRTGGEMDAVSCKQYLILDLLTWIINQGTADNRRLLDVAGALEGKLEGLIRSCYIFSNRTVSRKFTALIGFILSKLKSMDLRTLCRLVDALKVVLRRFVFKLDAYQNCGSSLWLLALAEEVYKISPGGCSAFIAEMQAFACAVGSVIKQRTDAYRKIIPSQRALLSFPFELEMFEISPPVLTLMHRAQQPFTYAAVASTGTSVTANFASSVSHGENDWLKIVGVDYSPPDGFSTKPHRRGQVVRLEREQLYGLIEVEPLQFVCYSASDGIRIENLDTGVSVPVAGVGNLVPTSTGAGPIPLPDMSQYEQSGNPALTSAVTSMKQQVQSILSKQMQLLAIQQQKQKLQVKLTDHVEKLANLAAEQIPATQASSASTFGVPTTPKTTPFMTPTPLSPSHLSPINSEVDLRFDDIGAEGNDREYGADASARRNTLVPAEFLKPPPVQALIVDRMSSGARKFLILSFEQPVLLTDLIIPQCGDIGSLSIDVWLKSESDDGQRLVVCNDISQKTLVLCDLQPPCLCQFLKITYIGRQGLGSCTSKIPVGNFYGYTYATSSQLSIVDGVGSGRSFEDAKALRRPSLGLDQLRQLEEDVRCRYSLACDQLRALLDTVSTSGVDSHEKEIESNMIEDICREISSIRIQWNLLHRAIGRMSFIVSGLQSGGLNSQVGYDKARVVSELLFATMLRISPLMKLDFEAEGVLGSSTAVKTVLSLETAVDLFERFCNCATNYLTAMSIAWILHHGAYADWWGAFFGVILDKFFVGENDVERIERLFLVLSFLVDRGLACGNNTVFLALLQRINNQIPENLTPDNAQWSFQLTLMLLSHSFDSFMHARMVGSRWDFLLGEYSKRRHSPAKGETDMNGNGDGNRNGKMILGYPDALQQSEELIAQHHQKVVQLSSELKKIVKTKPSKTSLFTKYKGSTSSPYQSSTNPVNASISFGLKPSDSGTRLTLGSDSPTTSAVRPIASTPKKPRLKLPYELCLAVSRKLASLILKAEPSFSAEIFILMCKVLSSITRCSRPLLHISDVFCVPGQIYELFRNAVVSRNVYVRRALVCLAQDLIISEVKCENARNTAARRSGATSRTVTQQPPGSESSGASMESDLEARTTGATSAKPAEPTVLDALAKSLAKMADEMQAALPSAEAGAVGVSGTVDPFDASAAGVGFIDSLVELIVPLSASNSKFSFEKRRQKLHYMLRDVLSSYVAKCGLSWLQDGKNLNEWVQMLTDAEEKFALTLSTEAQYDAETTELVNIILSSNVLNSADEAKPYLSAMMDSDPSDDTAFSPIAKTAPSGLWETMDASDLGPSVTTTVSVGPSAIVPSVSYALGQYYSSMPPASISGQNLAEAKDALWKLCAQLHASAAKVTTVYAPLSNVLPPPPQPGATSDFDLHLTPLNESLQMSGTTADGVSLWDEDSDSESTPMETLDAPLMSYFVSSKGSNPPPAAPAHLWKVQETYSDSAPTIEPGVQRISLALDERMESQLGWQAEVWIRRWLLDNNKRLRLSLQGATSFRVPNTGSSFVQQREQRLSHTHTSSAAAISDAFTRLFDTLSPSASSTYVENLLDTCWLLSIKNDTKTQEIPAVATVGAVYLGERAIKKLLSWLLDGIGISEKIWCLALRLLAASIRPKAGEFVQGNASLSGLSVVDEPNFPKVLRRLLTKARSSDSSELAGPAVAQSFADLLTCVHLHLSGSQRHGADGFREMLVKLLRDLLSERDLRTISQLPLDLLNKLVEFLLNYTGVWRLDARLVTDFANSLSLNLMGYLLSCDPSAEALLSNGAANPRYCFLVGKPDLTTNEFRCFHDRLDVVVVNLLKLGDKLLNSAGTGTSLERGGALVSGEGLTDDAKAGVPEAETSVAEMLFDSGSSFLENILNSIGLCYGGLCPKMEETALRDIGNVAPVTAADATVQVLFSLINRVPSSHLMNVLTATVNFMRASDNDCTQIRISDLSIYVLLKIFDICASKNASAFNDAGVVAVVAQQLVRSCEKIDPVPLVEYSHLLKSAAAVCGRGPRPTDSTAKKLSDVKVDGMTNFAPLCSIASSSPMAHHLTSLLNSTPPHRRARSAAWSYHFYPAETWLDVSLTLPYAIILKEIQIRPHLASLQSGPSAVQVELSPDNNPNSFRGLAPPMITAGCTKIRISTESFHCPVRMVRLHFKRPSDSTNFGMSQILLLGHTPLSNEIVTGDQRLCWLHLLHRTLSLTRTSFFEAANASLCASLCGQLVEMLLSLPLDAVAYSQLVDILAMMTARSGQGESEKPFRRLLERAGARDCAYRTSSLLWLSEAMSRLCLNGFTYSDTRTAMLVQWVSEALDGYCAGRLISFPLLRCIVWSCACVLWQWGENANGRKIAIRLQLIRILHKCARQSDDIGLSKACGYMLCSIVRTHPEYLNEILLLCGLQAVAAAVKSNDSDELKGARFSNPSIGNLDCADLRVLALVAQSAFSVRALESRGVLSYLVNTLTSMCVEGENNLDLMISIVELLRDIAMQPFTKTWINKSDGAIFLEPLLTYISLSPLRSIAPLDAWRRLESATISLLRRCISCHRESQRLVSNLIAQLLTKISGGLNSSLQQLILRVLLEDEKLTVAIGETKLMRNDFQINHPRFGCRIYTIVKEVSIYASCGQLMRDTSKLSKKDNVKKAAYGACATDPMEAAKYHSSLTDVTFAMEKAKAKRMAAKSAQGESKVDSSTKMNAADVAHCPVSYIAHSSFGNDPLPGNVTVGQLYCKLLSIGEDIDSLALEIRYGLSNEVNTDANNDLEQLATIRSTLEVFARQGGLALLAEHLQLYQPTVSVQNLRMGAGAYTDNQMKILEEMQASANKPFTNDPEMMDYYDPSYEWVNVASSGTAEGYIVDTKSQVGGCVRNVVSTGLSPHVVVCFGVFLRLPGYAELLVTQDRRQAQWLLRLAMGVTTDAVGVNIVSNSEAASMGILPFEILSSLYWTSPWNSDEGRLIRITSIELGIPQLLLRCLAAFSHQAERRSTPADEKQEVVRVVDQLLAALAYAEQPGVNQLSADDKSHLYWAKGTGFGTGSTQQHWNVDLHIVKQKQDEQSVACLLKVLAQFVYPGELAEQLATDAACPSSSSANQLDASVSSVFTSWGHFVRLISDSCLLPTLQSYLRNDSVLDISRHVAVYESVMRVLCSLALCPQLSGLLTELGDEQQSLRSLLTKLKTCVDIYISKLEPLKKSAEGVGSEEAATEEGLMRLVPLIERTTRLVQVHKADAETDIDGTKAQHALNAIGSIILSKEERYMRAMKSLQFDSFKFLREGNNDIRFSIPYHYEASVQGAKDIGALAPCVRRLAQEAVTLSSSLPLSYSSSVFVSTAEERLDVMKVLITGPSDTPYADGCFEFDVWFPTDYPNSPMHINLQTTGGSTVRFNPNLYNDGKVCLSILNTWHGRPEERWNAQTSSFLQVLVSIQSLILVSDPYFNEPGYERSRGTPAGQHASREYDANIRQATVRWAMLEMMRNPPACFKPVIHRHFWLKRNEITKMIEGWITDMESGSSAGADKRIQRNLLTHLTALKKYFSALKDEFAKMTRPEGLDDESPEMNEGCSSGKSPKTSTERVSC